MLDDRHKYFSRFVEMLPAYRCSRGMDAHVVPASRFDLLDAVACGLRSDELPPGRLIVSVSRHDVAIIGVVIHFATARAMKRGGSMDI
jgi:hypothetical protein